MSPKGPPFEFFVILQQNACLEIKKGPLFYIFRHCATFSERKFFLKISSFFQKNVLRFLSLRYSTDFRRSRLVVFFRFPVRNTLYRILRMMSLIISWSCGTDECFITNCEKDLLFGTAFFRKISIWSKVTPFAFMNVFEKAFCELQVPYTALRLFQSKKFPEKKYFQKLFFDVSSWGESNFRVFFYPWAGCRLGPVPAWLVYASLNHFSTFSLIYIYWFLR